MKSSAQKKQKHPKLIPVEDIENVMPETSTLGLRSVPVRDPKFESELEYDGYDSIEAYDNDEYHANVDRQDEDQIRVLNLRDRPETANQSVEENIVDKQDNHSRR